MFDATPEDLEIFLEEANDHLRLLDESVVQLEGDQANQNLLQEIFRSAHTLKGSAAMLGYREMAEMAHAMESVLDGVRKGALPVVTSLVDALLHSLDVLVILKDDLAASRQPSVDISTAIAELEQTVGEAGIAGQPEAAAEPELSLTIEDAARVKLEEARAAGVELREVRVRFAEGTEWPAVRSMQVLQGLSSIGEVMVSSPSGAEIEAEMVGSRLLAIFAGRTDDEVVKNLISAVEETVSVETVPYDPNAEGAGAELPVVGGDDLPKKTAQTSQTIRIDVERLDQLMNMVGELVIDRTRILQISDALKSRYSEDDMVQALAKTSGHIVKVVNELHETTLGVRMLPIGTVFSGFPRMIRDLARTTGKSVNFVVDGQDTEIDRTVIERIRDPLVHLLRNAVDHGAEPPEKRRAAGKPETATIRLSAYHAEGFIVIEIQDDGNGIDPVKLKDAAVSKGVISEEMAARLSSSELLDLIFTPGMSTAAKTTEVSGRGVGMDIVKSGLEAIGGFVNIDTDVGEGTKFTLKLPLTLATVRALLVSSDNALFAVPVVHVLEAARLEADDIETIDRREVFRLRENIVPLLRLGDMVGSVASQDARPDTTFVVVVRLGERLVGLGVDSLIELQEIVVKPLGELIGDARGVAGASVLGDGQVVLILDVPVLVSGIFYAAA